MQERTRAYPLKKGKNGARRMDGPSRQEKMDVMPGGGAPRTDIALVLWFLGILYLIRIYLESQGYYPTLY